jgi:hypothetical protein
MTEEEMKILSIVEHTLQGMGVIIHATVQNELKLWARRVTVGFVCLTVMFGLLYLDERKHNDEHADQACLLFEKSHLRDVKQLRQTYKFLEETRGREVELRPFILAGLPAQEVEASNDDAPPFCDEPGVGLPEPDPVVPQRPEDLNHEVP